MLDSITCTLVTKDLVDWELELPGQMWFDYEADRSAIWLSDNYKRDWAHIRPPIYVVLPDRGGAFCIDSCSTHPDADRTGWVVTGTAPFITVTPSINAIDFWHGYLTNGVLVPA